MARTVWAGAGSLLAVTVWCTISLEIGANSGWPLRIPSLAPHSRRLMTAGSGGPASATRHRPNPRVTGP